MWISCEKPDLVGSTAEITDMLGIDVEWRQSAPSRACLQIVRPPHPRKVKNHIVHMTLFVGLPAIWTYPAQQLRKCCGRSVTLVSRVG